MKLIVGLGNPTDKYKNNRHNIGFMVVDKLISNLEAHDISKKEFKGELYKSSNILLLKPQTYMNLSGESVVRVCNYYKIEIDDVIVIHDELDIDFGKIKIKKGGSSGGHNGIKSIDKHCTNEYLRVRVGISTYQHFYGSGGMIARLRSGIAEKKLNPGPFRVKEVYSATEFTNSSVLETL